MKYKLETIPVWDALKEDQECLLCFLQNKMEDYYLNYYLGSSVMNPETRVVVNQKGFCPDHYRGLEAKKKAHGLGLMTHTHLCESDKALLPLLKDLQKKAQKSATRGGGGAKKALQKSREQLTKWLKEKEESCLVCEGLNRTMKRYAFTIAWLWKDDSEFQQAFRESRGLCLHHLPLQMDLAAETLKEQELGDFLAALAEIEQKAMERLEGEILWFTQKFDAQNSDKDWGTSKDALQRTVQKLIGPIKKD